MKVLANLSIRNKIVGIILGTTIPALGFGFWLVSVNAIRTFEQDLLQKTELIARAAGVYSAVGLQFEDVQQARDAFLPLSGIDYVTESHIYSNDGQLLRDLEQGLSASYSQSGDSPPPPEVPGEPGCEIREGSVHCFMPVLWDGDPYGMIYVRGTTEALEQSKRDHLTYMFSVMAVLVIAAVIFAYVLQGFISHPILHLSEQTQSISASGDYSIRVEKPGNDEIGILYDEFNAMLAQIQRRQHDLERSNRDLDQFAYVASHDLKAPLRAIASLSSWIEEDIEDLLSAESREHLDLLRRRVQRMDNLIDGILEYSRAGRLGHEGERVDVRQLLEEVIELQAPPRGFTIAITSEMPVFTVRRLRLEQVFANLINNAIKYHHRAAGRIEIRARRQDGFFEFEVADDGPGIAPQHHEKVFMMFQTLQPRDQVESTGLGLSLVKKLVEEEGGEIHLESDLGAGSRFRFTWPVEPIEHGGGTTEEHQP